MTNIIDLTEVLDWVNKERAARDLPTLAELPKGERMRSNRCPISRSFEGIEGTAPSTLPGSTVLFNADDGNMAVDTIKHSPAVAAFVNAFDDGQFPELVA